MYRRNQKGVPALFSVALMLSGASMVVSGLALMGIALTIIGLFIGCLVFLGQ